MTTMNMNTNTKSMTAALQQAIFENNTGTRLMRHCHYDESVKAFTSVLQILKPLAAIVEDQHKHQHNHNHKHATNNNNNTATATATANASTTTSIPLKISFNNKSLDTDDNSNDDTIGRTTQVQSSSPVRSSSSSSSSSSPLPDNSTASTTTRKLKHFVFRDPVVIPPECIPSIATTTTDNDNDNDNIYYSSVLFSKFLMIVMYNLALTLHLQAISLISSSSSLSSSSNTNTKRISDRKKIKKILVRSRTLYELAFDMHLENTDVEQEECTLFTLALTNNLGLIYQITKDTKKCTSCFQTMFSTMMYLLDSSQQYHDHHEGSSSSVQASHRKEWNGMFSNAMDILFTHTYETAAAAA